MISNLRAEVNLQNCQLYLIWPALEFVSSVFFFFAAGQPLEKQLGI